MNKQPWIGSKAADLLFIISPPFVTLAIIAIFPAWFQADNELGDAGWVVLIILIDVAHVYSTLFKTYFDKEEFIKRRTLFTFVPLIGFAASVLVYSISSALFWRLLAYLAVFHFVRQQYGFMRLYSRNETYRRMSALADKISIYSATLFPLVYWHFSGPKNFNWFLENDFVYFNNKLIIDISFIIYAGILSSWVLKELFNFAKDRWFNVPKFLIIAGTALSWYFGIVYFNGDIIFTFLNVVSHGVPYMALIYILGKKKHTEGDKVRNNYGINKAFGKYGITLFLGILFLFAFIEEGLWDIAVWKERSNIFGSGLFDQFTPGNQLLSLLVPLLALPQLTHYILDGFIWTRKTQ